MRLAHRPGDPYGLQCRRTTALAVATGKTFVLFPGIVGVATDNLTRIPAGNFVWIGTGGESNQVELTDALHGDVVRDALLRQPRALLVFDPLSGVVELTLSTFPSKFPIVDCSDEKTRI